MRREKGVECPSAPLLCAISGFIVEGEVITRFFKLSDILGLCETPSPRTADCSAQQGMV